MNKRGILINQSSNFLLTNGLRSVVGCELKVRIQKMIAEKYIDILNYMVDFLHDDKPEIKPDQTIAYHSWLLKCKADSDFFYDLWEANPNGEGFTQGVDHSIKVVSEQEKMCKKFNELPFFPSFSQKVVISKGVYEGLPVEAVRYPSPNQMSGWWLTTQAYDDDIKSLMQVHYFHVAFKRPDLLKYFALPYGYRFFAGKDAEDIWFDPKVLLTEN